MAVASAGNMQIICTSLQTDNHASTSSLNFLQAGCSSWRPTKSVKALKAIPHYENAQYLGICPLVPDAYAPAHYSRPQKKVDPVISSTASAFWDFSLLHSTVKKRNLSYVIEKSADKRDFMITRAVQRMVTCRQSPYLHKPAIVIVTSFSLWRHYHCDVIR